MESAVSSTEAAGMLHTAMPVGADNRFRKAVRTFWREHSLINWGFGAALDAKSAVFTTKIVLEQQRRMPKKYG